MVYTFVRFALVFFFCFFFFFFFVFLLLFPFPLGVWEGLRFVIVALPGLFSSLFYVPGTAAVYDCGNTWTFLFPIFMFPVIILAFINLQVFFLYLKNLRALGAAILSNYVTFLLNRDLLEKARIC